LVSRELPPAARAGSFMQRPTRLFHTTLACACNRCATAVERPGHRRLAEPLVSLAYEMDTRPLACARHAPSAQLL
jgi:hypothetical protein